MSDTDTASLIFLSGRYLEHLRVRHYSEKTLKLRGHFLDYFRRWCQDRGFTRASEITKAVVQQYQTYLYHYRKTGIRPSEKDRPLSIRGQQMRLSAIRVFFSWLAKNNLILYNPTADIEMPREEHRLPNAVLTAQEVELVLQVPNVTEPIGLRDRAILETLYSTGIRRCEVVALKLYELDQERGLLRVSQGKGRRDRLVPIGERAILWIEKYLLEVRPRWLFSLSEPTLFINTNGTALTENHLTQLVRRYVDRSGIAKKGSCHLFRHSCATLMLENGADVRYIQQLLGHSRLETTQIYTHVSIRELKRVHERCHPAAHLKQISDPTNILEDATESTENPSL